MTTMATEDARQVHEVIDGGGLYFSRMATAGQFAFLGGVAADASGGLAAEAQVAPPYAISPPAHVVKQTTYLFDRYKELLEGVGSDINQFVQVEQHIPYKVYADGYIDTSRGPGFMEKGRPTSALLATGDLGPQGCVINPTGIAVIPGEGFAKEIPSATDGYVESLTKDEYGDTYAEEGPFNEIVTAGAYVFTVGDLANDWVLGDVHQEAKISPAVWWGNEIRNETEFILRRLAGWLERTGTSLENVVHVSVYLTEMADLFELDRSWKKVFGDALPGRTVIPCRGLGQPRIERTGLTHADKALKTEFIARSIRPGFGVEKEIVSTRAGGALPEAEAVKAGPLLWISGQHATDADGKLATGPETASQLEYLFGRLAEICEAGGSGLDQLVRIRAFLADPADAPAVYAALKRAIPNDPPTVVVTGVPGPMPYPGATVLVDGVANVPVA
jgi:enamine deaminase RidA (YjgF/YER057c/UK114 family)